MFLRLYDLHGPRGLHHLNISHQYVQEQIGAFKLRDQFDLQTRVVALINLVFHFEDGAVECALGANPHPRFFISEFFYLFKIEAPRMSLLNQLITIIDNNCDKDLLIELLSAAKFKGI